MNLYVILAAGTIGLGTIAYLMFRARCSGQNEVKLAQAQSINAAAERIADVQAHAPADSDALLSSLSDGSRKL